MSGHIKKTILCLIITLYSFFSWPANAQMTLPGDQLHLGQLQFKTSTTSPLAQAHFLLGLKYLHHFMYPLALQEFKQAQQADPHFTLSYWGQAMSYNWSLWSYQNKVQGRKVLQNYASRKITNNNPLELALMRAVSELYKTDSVSKNERNYLTAMRKIYKLNLQNADVASFYALSMIAYALTCPYDHEGEDLLATALQVLKPFIKTQPAHPGIIHYYMHASDVPNSPFPQQGLAVVENAYTYLSDSSHVLHMPSHLFTVLGYWPKAIRSNLLSIQASQHLCQFLKTPEPYACDADNRYHSMEWLQYEYLQMGETTKAAQLAEEMSRIAHIENENIYYFWSYRMQARQTLYTQEYKPITSLPKPLLETSKDKHWAAYSECGLLLADGISAIRNNQLDFLTPIDKRFHVIISQLAAAASESFKDSCLLAQTEVRAYKHAYIEHDYDTCSNELDAVEKIQKKLQSSHQPLTLPFIPSQEMFGKSMQSQPKYWKKIQRLYQEELEYYPNRTQALQGLADINKKLRH